MEKIVIPKYLVIFLTLFLWPLSFLLNNGFGEFLSFLIPAILVIPFLLTDSFLAVTFIPLGIINRALIFIPVLLSFYHLFNGVKTKQTALILALSFLVLFLGFRSFYGQSIFLYDHNARQTVISEGNLYPTIWFSRLFQNKPSIYFEKFKFNFFAIADPNNYFFQFHPREIIGKNQGLNKFPSLALIFFLYGLYRAVAEKKWRLLVLILIVAINLSLLDNFDKHDLILYLPLAYIIIPGIEAFYGRRTFLKSAFLYIFIIFTITEYLQLFLRSFLGML